MRVLAVDWTAVGSIASAGATIAAFLTIMATVAVYYFQSRRDRAAAIRQNIQFLLAQQVQVLSSIDAGLSSIIDRQARDFRNRLGPAVTPGYYLHQICDNRDLFRASAMDSNLSAPAYARMSGVWDELDAKAFELRGALRVFSYACRILTDEARRLCDPDFTIGVFNDMTRRGELAEPGEIDDLDKLVNTLLTSSIRQVLSQFETVYRKRIGQGSVFIGILADKTLSLSDRELLKLSGKHVQQPTLEVLRDNPFEAVSTSLHDLSPQLPDGDLRALREVIEDWAACGQPTADTTPADA